MDKDNRSRMAGRSIPIGVENFIKIRENGGYFIDKTRLIDEILTRNLTEVFLFTRPRRFGKSLNLRMLDAYFNQKYVGNTWFNGLEISKLRSNCPMKNSFPVIMVDFKEFDTTDYESFLLSVRQGIFNMFRKFPELRDSVALMDVEKELIERHLRKNSDLSESKESLKTLSEFLSKHYGQKVIILVDEYDHPVNDAYDSETRRGILDFLKDFMSSAFKGNDSLQFGIITGITRITKESIFSGLNNLDTYDVFESQFDDCFGFTPDEVQRLCADYGHPEKFEEAKEWYDGYRFGDAEIYNPWSLLKYVQSGFKPSAYWAGTSGNSIIIDALNHSDLETAEKIDRLNNGDVVTSRIDRALAYPPDGVWRDSDALSIMVASGYLNAKCIDDSDMYELSIPNKEMKGVFKNKIGEFLKGPNNDECIGFLDALFSCDTDKMESTLRTILSTVGSMLLPRDEEESTKSFKEANYNILVLTIVNVARKQYDLSADMEHGNSRPDIMMRSKDPSKANAIIELKWTKSAQDDLDTLAENAIQQIHDRRYHLNLKGRTVLCGIAFRGRDVRVRAIDVDGCLNI